MSHEILTVHFSIFIYIILYRWKVKLFKKETICFYCDTHCINTGYLIQRSLYLYHYLCSIDCCVSRGLNGLNTLQWNQESNNFIKQNVEKSKTKILGVMLSHHPKTKVQVKTVYADKLGHLKLYNKSDGFNCSIVRNMFGALWYICFKFYSFKVFTLW